MNIFDNIPKELEDEIAKAIENHKMDVYWDRSDGISTDTLLEACKTSVKEQIRIEDALYNELEELNRDHIWDLEVDGRKEIITKYLPVLREFLNDDEIEDDEIISEGNEHFDAWYPCVSLNLSQLYHGDVECRLTVPFEYSHPFSRVEVAGQMEDLYTLLDLLNINPKQFKMDLFGMGITNTPRNVPDHPDRRPWVRTEELLYEMDNSSGGEWTLPVRVSMADFVNLDMSKPIKVYVDSGSKIGIYDGFNGSMSIFNATVMYNRTVSTKDGWSFEMDKANSYSLQRIAGLHYTFYDLVTVEQDEIAEECPC